MGTTRYTYRGGSVLYESDSAGTVTRSYTWGGTNRLLAFHDGSAHYYVIADRLGSVRSILGADGSWLMSQRFTPYGERQSVDSAGSYPALPYGWTGREYGAETGFYYLRARYYLPLLRRFVQADPAGYGGGSNLYAYVGGDPLEAIDPTGMLAQRLRGRFNCDASCYIQDIYVDGMLVDGGMRILAGNGGAFVSAAIGGDYTAYVTQFNANKEGGEDATTAITINGDTVGTLGELWTDMSALSEEQYAAVYGARGFDASVVTAYKVALKVDGLGRATSRQIGINMRSARVSAARCGVAHSVAIQNIGPVYSVRKTPTI